jgi:ribosomal protein L37E
VEAMMARRRDQALAPQVIHHGFLLEVEGSRGLQAFDEKPKEENMSQECPECGKKLKAGEDDCAACGYSPKKLHGDDDDLIDVEADPREQGLQYLRQIKPEVIKGSDAMKRWWNDSWLQAKAGRTSVDRLQRAYESRRTTDARIHRRHGADADDSTSGQDLAEIAASYLGQDIGEVAAQREESTPLRAADSWPEDRRAVAQDLMARAERMGRQMRRAKY